MFLKALLVLLFVLPVAACSENLNIELESTINLLVLENGQKQSSQELDDSDSEYIELEIWLRNNQDGWKKEETSKMPVQYVSSGRFIFNIAGKYLIFSDRRYPDKTLHYKKELEDNELLFLRVENENET
jgi:hypothetical protein